ncbi:hypothetical protein Fmac_010128 [Flemingia macrophylla]|uniref:F-box protein n=1 Tax=Flemingia macrophylla TaxID=520843 RepID=A0ABD1N2D5_9FABA
MPTLSLCPSSAACHRQNQNRSSCNGLLWVDSDIRVDSAHVYSLNSGSWKEIDAVKLQPFFFFFSPVAITVNVFWLAYKAYDLCNDKLAMFHHYMRGNFESCSFDLWVLEGSDNRDVVGECWVKMYSVGPSSRVLYPLSIWRDEVVCMEHVSGHGNRLSGGKKVVCLFNPFTNESKNLLAHRGDCFYVPFTYAESLFQL